MSEPAIDLKDLHFRWQAHLPDVLDIPALRIAKGEQVFIQGESGSGKSTLLNLIGGVLRPQAGAVTVLGEPINTLSGARRDRFRADHIGFIFQMFNLIPYLTVLDNVLLPCRFSKIRADKAANPRQQAQALLHRLGLPEALFDRSATDLSVGQQQRVAAARALIGYPELVVADEPTSALDTSSRDAFLNLVLDQCARQGSTLLFVSHDGDLEPKFERSLKLHQLNQACPTHGNEAN